ncbi:phosphoinositide phosphatase SAC2-like isoform X2 [Tasmannia lanceolata]|uniref:phosphoinositide phosphatase SAC2-like isoform X2 n=1 Tax=Tasmannia lanceolata TaxID=3420 RepID=UPI0040643D69
MSIIFFSKERSSFPIRVCFGFKLVSSFPCSLLGDQSRALLCERANKKKQRACLLICNERGGVQVRDLVISLCDFLLSLRLGIRTMNTEARIEGPFYLKKFKLYETRSKFYMLGKDKSRALWRVLKIDRLDPSELNISEDSTTYSKSEYCDLLNRIHEGNRSTGGLKFVTICYGIIGFVKFFGPYYMLLITKRRQIGVICGHTVYAIDNSMMIPLPNSSVLSNMAYSKNENRYKKLLCTVNLTKDFFFSYSYHVMRSLQKNLFDEETGQVLYETMFVWNEFLTRGIRNILKNTLWTVALVYGFFKQAKLSISGKDFNLTLIARRSRHYAGTRYLKRGVNEKGRVANDVETEQIVFEDVPEGCKAQISSVVQNRGSIPLFWSQESSFLNIKPDIILLKKDINYEATRLHFQNLVKRYGNPIIILNLIKTLEKRPRESILGTEFANAVSIINKDLSEENCLKFLRLDLHKHSKRKTPQNLCNNNAGDADVSENGTQQDNIGLNENYLVKSPVFQKGVLRTNCIDCLDRTNVAQYAYGLCALGHQLHALGFINVPNTCLDSPLADDLMGFYETMGHTLALQYGGSAAHTKIFSERRGQWKAATQSHEFFKALHRYYSNVYMDPEKQDAINVFLGYFQPQHDKPALWELKSDQHYNVGENARSLFQRSRSVGDNLCESNTPVSGTNGGSNTPEISTCESDISYSRYTRSVNWMQLFADMQRDRCLKSDNILFNEYGAGDASNSSNFLDLDWISSSGNSIEEETYKRLTNPSITSMSSENVRSSLSVETTLPSSENGSSTKGRKQTEIDQSYEFSDSFVNWVTYGGTLCR